MNVLDDLLISRIRKLTLAALKKDKHKLTGLWAAKDAVGNWVIACSTCLMIWPGEGVDNNSEKLDKLLTDGFECKLMDQFGDASWDQLMTPDIAKVARAEEVELTTKDRERLNCDDEVCVFTYSKGWSRKSVIHRAYYRAEYLLIAHAIAGEAPLHFKIYVEGQDEKGRDKLWLIIHEHKQPIMVVANFSPDALQVADAKENARQHAG